MFALGQPKYHQINWNYLICGTERALMFDTGPGLRDIAPVARSLTRLPVIAMSSHLHYDHTGNLHRFEEIGLADLPILRACVGQDGFFHAPDHLYLGAYEDMVFTPFRVSTWWPPSEGIDLGGKWLEIVPTPGHSPDSVSLHDARANMLIAADFLYLDSLYAQVPGSSLPEYLATAERLYERLPADILILGAHGSPDENGHNRAPRLLMPDLQDLIAGLIAIREGVLEPVSRNPDRFPIKRRLNLLVGQEAYGSWQR